MLKNKFKNKNYKLVKDEDQLFMDVEESELERLLKDEQLKVKLDREAKIGATSLLIGVVALPVIALSTVAVSLIRRKK
jgi:hypothetical protein